MRILFICGALEPGKDGVGDYTRRLAGAVQSMGHEPAIIALYDSWVGEPTVAVQCAENNKIQVLRIASNISERNRYRRAKEWVNTFDPVWISLQFVPYAYNPKGLPFSLAKELKALLVNNRRLHIMFHEIWVGPAKSINWKRWLTAALQKKIIGRLINSLQPAVVHTQLPLAQQNLQAIKKNIHPLPLFSNIDLFIQPVQPAGQVLRVGFFSQATASRPIISFLEELAGNAGKAGRKIELLFIGGNPEKMRAVGDILKTSTSFKDNIFFTGFLPAGGISAAIQQCTLGITQVPRHALGKSGSVAAFLHHDIPVAAPVVQQGKHPKDIGFFSENLCAAVLLTPDLQALETAKEAVIKAKPEIDLIAIAKLFLSAINNRH